ncbi:hypothetical protein ABZ307_38080 [Streptomyces griseorubiginosus]|uniref:hypothetical protein n=1 Tax=Streptomyces griseorubiginosus TaxID=67304 RepID=UPI0033B16E78
MGLCLTRSGILDSWPVDDFLALLGVCRGDLTELRGVFAELLAGCQGQADARYFGTDVETERVRQLLERGESDARSGGARTRLILVTRAADASGSPGPGVAREESIHVPEGSPLGAP